MSQQVNLNGFKYYGCLPAVPTPFINNKIDKDSYIKLLDFLISNGVHGIVALGTTAETATLTESEKAELLTLTKETIDKSKKNIPMIVGVGSNNPVQTEENIKFAEKYKADALLLVTPYYNKPTQLGLVNYFTQIAKSTSKDIILYNVPSRTGVNMTADTVLELTKLKNIVGVKDASGDFSTLMQIAKYAPPHFALLSGEDLINYQTLVTGGIGYISVVANIVPKAYSDMFNSFVGGDFANAKKISLDTYELNNLMFIESNPTPVKYALHKMGILTTAEVRSPLCELTDVSRTTIDNFCKNYKLY